MNTKKPTDSTTKKGQMMNDNVNTETPLILPF